MSLHNWSRHHVLKVLYFLRNRLREGIDTLYIAAGVALAPEVGDPDSEDKLAAITAVDELLKLEANTSFAPPFPLEHVAMRHPGRMTANGLGSLEIGHADH